MLEKEKQEILDENYFLNKRKDARKKTKFELHKRRFFSLGVIIGIIVLVCVYFLSSLSNVKYISYQGNTYLKEELLSKSTTLSLDDKFILLNTSKIAKQIKTNPFVKECIVKKESNSLISINVTEYKIVGYTNIDGIDSFLLENGELVSIDEDNLYLISKAPLIEGYDSDSIKEVAKGFSKVDTSIIDELSEIHRYPFSYDANMMEVIMRDGNYIFASPSGFKLLDMTSYYTVIADVGSASKICLYLDEVTGTLQYRGCPWEAKNEG